MRETVLRGIKEVGRWIPVVLLALIFVPQGWAKFNADSGWGIAFRHWGYPDWFRIMVGVVELAGVGCLLWPRFAPVGATLLLAVMVGAEGTHIVLDHGQHMSSEIVPSVLAIIVLIVRRKKGRRLGGR